MDKKRSPGVTLCGVLFIIWPLFYLVRVFLSSLRLTQFTFFSFLPDIQNPVFFIQKILFIACGIGILRLKKWARILALCISLFGIVVWLLITIIFRSPLPLANKIVHIVIYVFLGWFFSLPKVKEQFK